MDFIELKNWLNSNIGLLNVILFLLSLLLAWVTGIYKALIKRPHFKIKVIPKVTFGSVFLTGEKYIPPGYGEYDAHKTAFAVYLEVTNIGSAPSKLGKIKLGFYRDNKKYKLFQKRLWGNETVILADFFIPTADENALVIPHLRQYSDNTPYRSSDLIEVGASINGVAYFEFNSSWGNYYPREEKTNLADVKIVIMDAFENKFSVKINIPIIDFNLAQRYNPRFGLTELLLDKEYKDLEDSEKKEDSGGIVTDEK